MDNTFGERLKKLRKQKGGCMLFNENLKQKRLERGLTQQEVADILGVFQGSYANWEKGNREPNFDNLIKLAEIFYVTTDELLGYKVKK
ncbi:helix-turn-helix domain-containing protein [Streptococcus sp. 20-1249]|uniref:helix-turn-helix domain-containing protein n=1 Tax=Streptococcus hepaticus TaxID=3349163 RepID=UPI0037487D7A